MTDADRRPDATPEEGPRHSAGAPAPGAPPADPVADPAGRAAEGAMATETEEQEEPAAASDEVDDDLERARQDLAELTGDLQRLQAEFLNYKRRVDRDRELIRENATYAALAPIIEVIDTIDRAREHGPLEEGLRAVADQLERVVNGLGLVKFGTVGDPFDPSLHEALSHIGEDPDVEVTTCKVVAKSGYRIGDRVVRAAQVLVVDPPSGPTDPGNPVGADRADQVPSGE